jgi:hypothetical protein
MVQHITINEKEWPIRIGYYVMKRLKEDTGKGFGDLENDISLYEHILLYSLQIGCKTMRIECPFKMEDMEEALEDCYFEFMEKIPLFFPSKDDVKMGKAKPGKAKK